MNNPGDVANLREGYAAAIFYWSTNDLNTHSDDANFLGLTEAINGGTNGLADRCHHYASFASLLGATTSVSGC